MSTTEHGFLPRWRQLEETAFWYAERAARATNATERDRWTTAAMETVVAIARMALGKSHRCARGSRPAPQARRRRWRAHRLKDQEAVSTRQQP